MAMSEYTPTREDIVNTLLNVWCLAMTENEAKRSVREFFDEHDRQVAERVWLEALQHVQRLSDPARTTSLPPDRGILTLPDVYQAMAENPYRTGETNEN